MKRIISVFLVCMLLFSTLILTTSAQATSGTCGNGVSWQYSAQDASLVISGLGNMSDFYGTVTPWSSYKNSILTLNVGSGVQNIGSGAFQEFSKLVNVSVASSVQDIGAYAFYKCTALKSVTLPTGVKEIGHFAFGSCTALDDINLSETITSLEITSLFNTKYFNTANNWSNGILYLDNYFLGANTTVAKGIVSVKPGVRFLPDQAFSGCNMITDMILPESLTDIGYSAAINMKSLKTISIGSGVKNISFNNFFSNCHSINTIRIAEANAYYSSVDGVLYNKKNTEVLYFPPSKQVNDFTVPDSVNAIAAFAFYDSKYLTEVYIPQSVRYISDYALGYYKDDTDLMADGFSIYGAANTEAEKYCTDNELDFYPFEGSDCICGDVDGDTKITSKDAIILQRYIAGWYKNGFGTVPFNKYAADADRRTNQGGKINSADVMVLQRKIATWSLYQMLPYTTNYLEDAYIQFAENSATRVQAEAICHDLSKIAMDEYNDEKIYSNDQFVNNELNCDNGAMVYLSVGTYDTIENVKIKCREFIKRNYEGFSSQIPDYKCIVIYPSGNNTISLGVYW